MSSKLLVCLFSIGLFAQTSQVGGRVTDASGAAVPGVQVSVRGSNTGTERQVRTNDSGLYTVPLLQPGSYEVQVRRQGFKPILQSGITLEVDQRAELNFRLEVGAVTERVEVRASVSRLNTVEASQGQVIDNRRIVEMPLNGRNYIDLALMSGGAVQSAPGSRIGGFSAGGQRVSQNNYIMDGIDNNSVELAAAGRRAEMVQPSIDAIAEFKVRTNAYSAEFGRGMGGVAFVRPANFTYGNSGRNVLRGRSQFNWDFSALKSFQLLEHLRLQFRFEAFTLSNTPRFGAPGNVLDTAAFGVITGAATPRNLQFGLKLIW